MKSRLNPENSENFRFLSPATHQYVLKEVWGYGYIEQTQYLRVFIAKLRKKIEDDPAKPRFLNTVSGIGYRFGS